MGRVRLIFKLPPAVCRDFMPNMIAPGHLAYVEWFMAFTEPDPVHGLYKVTRCRDRNRALLASVIEVRQFNCSCHLFPVCPSSGIIPRHWSSSTVLDSCEHFWVSPFSDLHMYMTFFERQGHGPQCLQYDKCVPFLEPSVQCIKVARYEQQFVLNVSLSSRCSIIGP